MAKGAKTPGKNSRSARRGDEDDGEDSRSVTGTSNNNNNMAEETDLDEGLGKFLSDLNEKKASGSERIAAFKAIDEEILSCCSSAIRKGSAAEGCLAAQVLGLLLVSLPETSERLFRNVQSPLQKAATGGSNPALRAAAIESLAMCCFTAAEDELTTQEVMEAMQGMWNKGSAQSRSAALRGWSLLFTSLPVSIGVDAVEVLLEQLTELLTDKEVQVRNSAGEAAALVYYKCGVQEAADATDDVNGYDDDYSEMGITEGDDGLHELVDRMNKLATNRGDQGGLRRNKRERASLKTKFRGLLGGLKDGSTQAVKYGDVLTVDTLEGSVTLGAFKSFLAGGFQVHLQRNPLLHTVFQFEPLGGQPDRMSDLEKRMFKSPSSSSSKARTADRKKGRDRKDMSAGSYGDDF
eukprot:gene8324-1598_t